MAILASQPAVGTAASLAVTVPAGPCTLILSNTSGETVYVGGPEVTADSGFPVPSGSPPVPVPGYPGSAESELYAVAGSAATLGVIISTDG
jgi:hypothetical protein